jgi:predicted DNA-binding transcriptional regulator AlpA
MVSENALPAEPEFERLFADIAPGLHDWVLQDIIEWVRYIYERLVMFFNYYWTQFTALLSNVRNWILEQATNAITNWWHGLQFTFFWIKDTVFDILNRVTTIASEVYHNVSQALEGMVNRITSYIGPFFSQLGTQLGSWFSQVWTWISTTVSQLANTVWGWVQETWSRISTFFGDLWARVADWFDKLWQKLTEVWGDINSWISNLWAGIKNIPGLVLAGLEDVAGKIGDKLTGWLEKDIEEALKKMEEAAESEQPLTGSPFWAVLAEWLMALLPLLIPVIKKWLPRLFVAGGILALEKTGKLEDLVEKFITPAFVGVITHFEGLGPMAPQPGGSIAIPITKVLTTTIAGLSAFVLAGGVMGLFKQGGLGVVSAMLYDLTNFRTLTAAFMTAFAGVYIAQPMKYYYQDIARPLLPQLGDMREIAKDYGFAKGPRAGYDPIPLDQVEGMWAEGKENFRDVAKYHGLGDKWLDDLYDDSFTPPRYFPLKAMADAGIWDEEFYTSQLMKSGYTPPMIKGMLSMLQKMSLGEIKGVMLPLAITRFREGFSDVADLKTELGALGLPESKIDLYIFAAQLSYQTDYASDMLAAYRTQFRKDMITEDDFRKLLKGLGINPLKVEGYVLRENASKFKPPKVTKVPKVIPEYLTDEGQLRVNTAKEAFRRDLSSAAELEAELVKLEMPPDLAEAYTEFEIIRKTKPPTA